MFTTFFISFYIKNKMSRIAFRIVSIELKNSTIHNVCHGDLIRINITSRPTHNKQEYILNNYRGLANINHEFNIEDPQNEVNRITMTLRTVIKSSYFNNMTIITNMHTNAKQKQKDHSIDNYIRAGTNENRDDNVQCVYLEPKHSLIGYCTIKMKNLEVGVNNTLKVELLSRSTSEVVGYANLEVYVWREPTVTQGQISAHTANEPILFVDPGCPTTNQQPVPC